jgi:two-component system phosphate regulon sensor histidine kinase PhoR
MLERIPVRVGAAFLLIVLTVLAATATGSTVVAACVGLVAAAALTLILAGLILEPLRRITRAVSRLAGGNLQERISRRPAGELGELAEAFNQMAGRVEELVEGASRDHDRMLAALNSSADGVVALDSDDVIAFANVAAERLFQRTARFLTGHPFAWAMPDAQAIDALRASRAQGEPRSLVVERPYKQHLQMIVTPIINGGDWASLVVFHDVTEVRRVETMRRDFVANVSHELRTPLAALKSVIETLQTGAVKDPDTAADFLSRADAELDRLVNMVEELLQLSRIESGEVPLSLQQLEIREVLETAVHRMAPNAEKHGLRLSLDVQPAVPAVMIDRVLMERAVINLIDNAVKFTPEGGSIVVSADSTDGAVNVEVRDTGEGIDPVDLPRVFERFYKTDRARRTVGTGLGLAIVKHTIEAHGGMVRAESDPGRGSTFAFSIPVRAPAET